MKLNLGDAGVIEDATADDIRHYLKLMPTERLCTGTPAARTDCSVPYLDDYRKSASSRQFGLPQPAGYRGRVVGEELLNRHPDPG